jgi:anti-sigma regulatory factor (Ser/Thr protein kinase)
MVYKKLETSSNINEISKIRNFIAEECQRISPLLFDKDCLTKILTAVSEAAGNIMRHAYEGRINERIIIELTIYDDKIKITFTDWGKGFEPSKIPSPIFDGTREGGYGWYIINHFTDKVYYSRNNGEKNTLILIKKYKVRE